MPSLFNKTEITNTTEQQKRMTEKNFTIQKKEHTNKHTTEGNKRFKEC